MTINGLPAHVLIVHLVVVVLPLTAAAAILGTLWAPAQRKLTFLIPLGAALGFGAAIAAVIAGNSLAATFPDESFIEHHHHLGILLLPWAGGFALASAAQWWQLRGEQFRRRSGTAVGVLVVLTALGTIVLTVLTGDAGAQAVWSRG